MSPKPHAQSIANAIRPPPSHNPADREDLRRVLDRLIYDLREYVVDFSISFDGSIKMVVYCFAFVLKKSLRRFNGGKQFITPDLCRMFRDWDFVELVGSAKMSGRGCRARPAIGDAVDGKQGLCGSFKLRLKVEEISIEPKAPLQDRV